MTCELCKKDPKDALWHDDKLFVINVNDPLFPGYLRVIWIDHVAEVSELNAKDRQHLFEVLTIVETVMRETMRPDKVNWAQFGNMVPHLHWHLIPRFKNDTHFPESVWGIKQREENPECLAQRQQQAIALCEELPKRLDQLR